ncbi:hypothetical protein, partial [Mycolicibacterium sp. CBMA 329]
MQVTARSPLAAGVALIGATAIALTPVTAPAPAVHVPAIHSAVVELSSFQNPLALWADVLGAAGGNVVGLAGQWLEDPAPMLTQIIANQIHSLGVLATAGNSLATGLANAFNPENDYGVPAILQKAFGQIAAGEFEDGFLTAFSTVVFLGMPIMMAASQVWPAISQPFKNVANLVDGSLFPLLMGVGLGMLVPFEPVLHVAGRTIEDAVSAVKAMDLVTLASTVINAPAALTGAFLNGYMDPEYHFLYPGLLSAPPGSTGSLSGILSTFGQLANLIKTPGTDRHDLGGALTGLAGIIGGIFGVSQANRSAVQKLAADAPATDEIAAAPAAAAQSFTLTMGGKPDVVKTVTLETPVDHAPAQPASTGTATKESSTTGTDTEPTTDQATTPSTGTGTDNASGSESTGSESTGSGESTGSKPGTIVRNSPKAEPGKPGIATKRAGSEVKEAVDSVGKEINSTVKKIS